jgi:hypothetical protein
MVRPERRCILRQTRYEPNAVLVAKGLAHPRALVADGLPLLPLAKITYEFE